MAKNLTIKSLQAKILVVCMLLAGMVHTSAFGEPSGEASAVSAMQAAKSVKVSGTVTDENNEGLIGASVVVVGSSTGVSTNIDGTFTIDVPANGTLEVSYLGYDTQRIVVGTRSNIKIQLEPDKKILDEVVVIGYGAVKKKDLTGAVAAVSGDALAAKKTVTLSTALQGAVSGVIVNRDNGAPGASASSIRVRGITTMSTNDPLIIVDGAECSNIDYVNANDVESISVLKDASAASIYGSKAAAGVILITTKRGAKSAISLSYSGEFGWEIPTMQPDMVGAKRYMEMVNEMNYNDNNAVGFFSSYSADRIKNYAQYNASDPNNYPITNWRSLIINDSAFRQSHNVSISGGSESVRSKVSLSYDGVGGIYERRDYQRYMLRTNNDFTIVKDKLNATVDVNIRRAKSVTPNFDPFEMIRYMPGVYAATWDDGRIAEGKSGANPYGLLKGSGDKTSWSTQVGGRASLEWKPVKGLSLQGVIAPFINYTKSKQAYDEIYYTAMNEPETIAGPLDGGGRTWNHSELKEERKDSYNVTTQFIANYMRSFGKHDLTVMAGYENYVKKEEELGASRDQNDLPQYHYLDVGNADMQYNSGKGFEYASNSFFGRIMYSYADRYLFQANIRYDGSSRFDSEYRWGAFPSFSAGWVMSEEGFLKNNADWLSFLKLRASWGMLGNERLGNEIAQLFPYLALINFNNARFYDADGNVVSDKTAAQKTLSVKDVTWETTTSTDIGIDVNFFKNRLTLTADYYWKETKDMLLDIEIPYFMGYGKPKTNAGTMKTTGYDIELGWQDRKGDFSYKIAVNFSDFLSKITYINHADIIDGSKIKREGEYFNAWYGYRSKGINQETGDIEYVDISGPNGVPDGVINDTYDRVVLGNSQARFLYGGTINLAWKGLDFSMAFQGVGKRLAYLSSEMVQGFRNNYGSFPGIIDGKYWSVFNTEAQNLKAEYPRLTKTGGDNYRTSDFWLFNGGYFRMKNVTLGYTLPSRWTKKISMQQVRVYASASDLFVISNYPKGWDPEMGTKAYPITTSVLLGLSVKF